MTAPIGILGGMGPHAGILLAERILAHTRAVRDQDHLPVALLSYADRVPDRTAYLAGAVATNPAEAILDVAAALHGLGARVAGMPCNTAHAPPIFEAIANGLPSRAPGLRLLHLVEETVAHAVELVPHARSVGVLATLGTYRSGLYDQWLDRSGLRTVLPDESVRTDQVHAAIYDPAFGIKARSSPVTDRAMDHLLSAIDHLADLGADAVILGCTELSLAFDSPRETRIPTVDATTALARALVRAVDLDRLLPLGGE